MKMILSGGGGAAKNPAAFDLFIRSVNKHKPVLYLCFASRPENYADAYGKFTAMMVNYEVYSTRLCDSPEMFDKYDLSEFGGIFCAGGNTFRLLKTLRDCRADRKIKDYLKNGGVYYGTSAGAIIAGADIMPIIYLDANAVVLRDTHGLNMIGGWSTVAHYGDASSEFGNNEWNEAVLALSAEFHKLIALSEESAILVEESGATILGEACKIFENGEERMIENGGRLF